MTEIRVPDIGDVDEVEVIELCVAPGDIVEVDDPIVVIESDKASMEVPAPVAGTVTSLAVAVGDMVSEGDLLADVSGEEAASAAPAAEEPAAQPAEEPAPAQEPVAAEPAPAAEDTPAPTSSTLLVAVPDIGDAEDVVVIEVAVSVGDEVAADDVLVVVESDKASMEIPAPSAGRVEELHVALDDNVSEGTPLVTLAVTTAAAPAASPPAADKPSESPKPAAPSAPTPQAPQTPPTPQTPPSPAAAAPDKASKDVYAGPAVRRLARELGADLTAVKGSGNRGRITKDDVKAFVKERMQSGPSASSGAGIPLVPAVDFSKFGPVELEPITRMRRVGAENLHRSWLNVPHVTQHDEADVTTLEEFRKGLTREAEQRGIKVTPLAFLAKACAEMLTRHPRMNSSLDASGENFVLKKYYNIGMAVDTPEGLIVPVIKDADKKGIWELSEEIASLAAKARDGKLGMGDLQGGTFSISSLGAIGGTGFTPIVNAPEVAILGVGKLATKPVWDGQAFQPRQMLPLSLSYDHRVINGAEAGRFMTELCQLIADLRRALL